MFQVDSGLRGSQDSTTRELHQRDLQKDARTMEVYSQQEGLWAMCHLLGFVFSVNFHTDF